MSLGEYTRKRDFKKTAEPRGTGKAKENGRRFVIQKHAARRLHYDFRLELGGALKSWAVPKGIPLEHGERRLAVHVEDHPLAYADFEGSIPEGQYGAGTVMVWDRGTFEPLSRAPLKELENGKLHFVLHGEKLEGEWYLVRMHDSDEWLLIRGGGTLKAISKKQDDTSALTGKSMRALAESGRVWNSKARTADKKPARRSCAKKGKAPAFVEPMKAKLVESPPRGSWLYEIKFDGWRALALKGGSAVQLLSRNRKSFTDKFPEIVEGLAALDTQSAIIDGEIVALDDAGRSSFQLLQARDLGEENPATYFYAFDLLHCDGEDLRGEPIEARKERLEKLLTGASDSIRYSAALGSDAKSLLAQAKKLGLEGLIGKRAGSAYETGRRSGSWIKLKLQREQEFVIGGYTEPGGARKHFGALIVGYYEKGRLLCAGKVGTGFDEKLLASLHADFRRIATDACPFANLPEKSAGRWMQGITPAVMKRCHWVKPTMVCQLKFNEWTRDGRLRQPVFLGLRKDKNARDVVRETPA